MDQVTQNQRNNHQMEGEEDTPNQPNNNNNHKLEGEKDTPNQPNNNLMDTSHTDANTNHKTDNCKDKERLPAALIIAAIFGSLGSSFTFGYDITVVNAPALYVQDFYNQTWLDRYVEPLGTDRSIILWSITVSIGSIGAMFGTVAVPPLVKVLGRRGTLLMNNSFTLVGALFMAVAERSSSFEMMIIGRFLLGLHCGIGGNTIPIFMAEISPIQLRGAFGQLIGVGCFMGIIVGQVLGLTELLGHETRWNFLFAFMAIPALLQLCVLPLVPESPRYLLIDKNNVAGAEKALRRYLGKEDVSQELEELQVERCRQASLQKVSVLKLMRSQDVRWQIISVIVIMSGRTLSGINVLFYYTNMILEDAGIDENLTTYFTISLGLTGLISSIVGGFLIDRLGRRILLLLYFGGMAVGLALLTVFLNIQDQASWIPFLSFSCIILANIPASVGAWAHYVVNTELFEQTYRPPALMIGGGLNWMCNFIVSMLFPFMQEALQTYVFLVFMVISSLCAVYIYFVLPETKNKTFVEISQLFKKINNISDSSSEFEPKPEGVANIVKTLE